MAPGLALGRCSSVASLLFALAATPAAVRAEDALPAIGSPEWRAVTFPRVPQHTRYVVGSEGGEPIVSATSECSASALVAPAAGIDLARTPILHWRWRVEESSLQGDPRTKGGDDFAARVYVMFAFDASRASAWQRARHAIGRRLFGEGLPGSALNYVVSRGEPAGARWDNPYTESAHVVSRGPLAPGAWREERADVEADYRARFGAAPPALLGVGLMTDSDDGCGRARASFADLRFAARPPAAERGGISPSGAALYRPGVRGPR